MIPDHVTVKAQREVIADQARQLAELRSQVEQANERVAIEVRKRITAEYLAEERVRPQRWDAPNPMAYLQQIRDGIVKPVIATAYITDEAQAYLGKQRADDEAKAKIISDIGTFMVEQIGITSAHCKRTKSTVYTLQAIIGHGIKP